jgi:hypothetical protein
MHVDVRGKMHPVNTTETKLYSSKDDRSAAWFLALFGIVGFFDFYMKHPIKGAIKLGILIIALASTILDTYNPNGITSILLHGYEVVFIWNVYNMFQLSRGHYRDGDGHPVKKETRDASVLFWFIVVSPFVLILALIVGVLFGHLRIPVA